MTVRVSSNVYLCARFGRREELRDYSEHLITRLGIQTTSRWLFSEHVMLGDPNTPEGRAQNMRFAIEDLEDVMDADTIIGFTEEKFTSYEQVTDDLCYVGSDHLGTLIGAARGGRHVEFGYAAALNKRLIVVGPRENVFHWLPEVEQYDSFSELVKALV
jgi:hypothetical protein